MVNSEGPLLSPHCPNDAGEFVRYRDSGHRWHNDAARQEESIPSLQRTRRKRRAAERTRYAERCTSRFSRWVLLNGVASRSAQPRDSHRDESPPALLGPLTVDRE